MRRSRSNVLHSAHESACAAGQQRSLPPHTRKVVGSKKSFDWNLAADQASILNAFQALGDYLEDMIARRRRTLTDDLVPELIRGEDDGEKLDHDELLSLAVALLGTGTDTTRHQRPPAWTFSAIIPTNGRCSISSNSFLTRWGKPCATDLSASPCLASPPNTSSWRGVCIPAGTIVFANTAAANRDPAAFSDPDRFDITRDNMVGTLSFGNGAH
jgi:cytochrome P450